MCALRCLFLARLLDFAVRPLLVNAAAEWQWTVQRGTPEQDLVSAMVLTQDNGVILAGSTDGELDGRTPTGSVDIYLMKFASDGAWSWTTLRGSDEFDTVSAMVQNESSGDLFVAGHTSGDLSGSTNAGNRDVFLMKFSSTGVWRWTQQRGSDKGDNSVELDLSSVSSSGELFLAGHTFGSLDGHTHAGNCDIFLMKFAANGDWEWTEQRGTPECEQSNALAVTPTGDAYIAGYTFGGLGGNDTHQGGCDVFLAKFSSNGTLLWTKQRGTSACETANSMLLDSSGNVFLAGWTSGELDGEPNAGEDDVFLMKLTSEGEWLWTRTLGSAGSDKSYAMAFSPAGDIYIAGTTTGNLEANFVNQGGQEDVFLAKFTSDGDWLYTRQRGSEASDSLVAMVTSPLEEIYLAGFTTGWLDGNSPLGEDDIFLMKFTDRDTTSTSSSSTSTSTSTTTSSSNSSSENTTTIDMDANNSRRSNGNGDSLLFFMLLCLSVLSCR
mmetsp:Transcript_12358/g.29019  ORF Transcript_12358/g.29019 Transcript_12358/m.29019 type:complete len:494 (+) Transcript_12358:132-1613(+)